MGLLFILVIYLIFAPVIFFLISNSKNNDLKLKITKLEKEIKLLKESKKVIIKEEPLLDDLRDYTKKNIAIKTPHSDTIVAESKVDDVVSSLEKPIVEPTLEKLAIDSEKTTLKKTSIKQESISIKEEIPNPKQKEKAKKPKSDIKDRFTGKISLESIIGKLGALLLLVGIGFVYKLAYDNGYIGKGATVFIGYIVSAFILISGIYFVKKGRLILSQILMGTAFAASYITTYTAYLNYHILSDLPAFSILIFTSLIIFFLSYKFNYQSVITIASVCSISVPFIVDMKFLGIMGFGFYLICLALLSMLVYLFKKWHVLQIATMISVYIALFITTFMGSSINDNLLLLNILIVALSAIIALPDITLSLFTDDKFNALKSALIQVFNIVLAFILIFGTEYFTNDGIAYLMLAYSSVYIISTLLSTKKSDFKLFAQCLYVIAVSSLVISVSQLCIDIHLGLFLLGVSVALIFFDKYVKAQISFYVSILTYLASLFIILFDLGDEKALSMIIMLVASLILLILADKFIRQDFKEKFRFISYQVFLTIYTNLALLVYMSDIVPSYDFYSEAYPLLIILNTVLFAIFTLLSKKFEILKERNSLYVFLTVYLLEFLFLNLWIGTEAYFTEQLSYVDYLIPIITVGVLILFSRTVKDKITSFFYHLNSFILLQIFAFFYITNLMRDFRYGILLSSLLILVFDFYIKRYSVFIENPKDLMLSKISKYVSIFICLVYFGYIYPFVDDLDYEFNVLSLLVNSINMKLFFNNLRVLRPNKYVRYVISTIMILYLSYVHVYIPTSGNHYVSLIWATYVIITMIYYIRRSDVKMVNISLASLILIVCKFVLIDLSSASLISKVITSIAFGLVLMALSYMMPRLIKNYAKDDVADDDNNLE